MGVAGFIVILLLGGIAVLVVGLYGMSKKW